MSEAECDAAGTGRPRPPGGGPEPGSGPAQQEAANGPAPQAEVGANGYAPQQPGPAAANAMHGQPWVHAAPGPQGYPAQHPPYYQPQYQQAMYVPAGYGHPYPGGPVNTAMGAAVYQGAYAPPYHPAYPPPAFQAYPPGAMANQAAPMGGHSAAAMIGTPMSSAPGAGAQAGAGQGPGPLGGMQELFEEFAQGGNGLNSLTRMLSLDDTEFWKGALVGAAAVLLLTNDQVQDALFKSGAKAKSAVKSGADKLKERASASSATEGNS